MLQLVFSSSLGVSQYRYPHSLGKCAPGRWGEAPAGCKPTHSRGRLCILMGLLTHLLLDGSRELSSGFEFDSNIDKGQSGAAQGLIFIAVELKTAAQFPATI